MTHQDLKPRVSDRVRCQLAEVVKAGHPHDHNNADWEIAILSPLSLWHKTVVRVPDANLQDCIFA